MFKAKIYGAGSIGAHYAHELVNNGFEVDIFDISKDALLRFKKKIYPINLQLFSDLYQPEKLSIISRLYPSMMHSCNGFELVMLK